MPQQKQLLRLCEILWWQTNCGRPEPQDGVELQVLLDLLLLFLSTVAIFWLVMPGRLSSSGEIDVIGVLAAIAIAFVWFVGWQV